MMKIFCSLLLMLVFAHPAFGEYVFQITTEKDVQGKCINWQDITADVTYTLNPDSTKLVLSDIPDEDVLDDDDLQEWYIPTGDGTWNLISFSFTGVGMTIPANVKLKQYWFRCARDGILFSDAQGTVVVKSGKPVKK